MTFAEGIFLAIRPPVAKPDAIALLKKLMAGTAATAARPCSATRERRRRARGGRAGRRSAGSSRAGARRRPRPPTRRVDCDPDLLRHLPQRHG